MPRKAYALLFKTSFYALSRDNPVSKKQVIGKSHENVLVHEKGINVFKLGTGICRLTIVYSME